jgi:hypothetical protein
VPPEERYLLADGTCRAGYVWVGVPPKEKRCVTPQTRAVEQAKYAREKLRGGLEDFAGDWETSTEQGATYGLSMKVEGEEVYGKFAHASESKYDGTLFGRMKGDDLEYEWSQPTTGARGGGTFKVYRDGVLDGTIYFAGKTTWWRGKRVVNLPNRADNPDKVGRPHDFKGTWDTHTEAGGHFELTLLQTGPVAGGTFKDLNGNPQYDGTLTGRVTARTFEYTYQQKGTLGGGKGSFVVTPDGKSMEGTFATDRDPKKSYRWWGTWQHARPPTCTPPQFLRPNGTCGCQDGLEGEKCDHISGVH